jgi:hypothetical protein
LDRDREQGFFVAASLRDWLAEDHLAWCVIDAVGRMDLAGFYAAYRADGRGSGSAPNTFALQQLGGLPR